MTAIPSNSGRRYTLAEYLEFEEASPAKHEFHHGEILAMSGSSPEHALITVNVLAAIHARLAGKPCRVYSSDLKIAVGNSADIHYPDGSVICGPLEFHPADPRHRLITNPRVIVEVLSPTTEAYDRGAKFSLYRTLPSLEEYVLVSQDKPMIETFVRQADGRFVIAATFAGLDATATLSSLNIQIALADVYAGVTFPGPIPQPIFPERESS
jgi:Uma2 family endonuclease